MSYNINTPILKTYIQTRAVQAMNPEEAQKKFDANDLLVDNRHNNQIVLENELFPQSIEKCPMCDALSLEYTKLKTQGIPYGKDFDHTHIWVCEDCAFIGFEFYVKENAETLNQFLHR